MRAHSNNQTWLTSFDYINFQNYKIQEENNNLFVYNISEEACTKSFYSELQYNYFDRELYEINYLLRGASESKFKIFFKNFNIDTPEVLNKTHSLRRFKGLTPLTRLVFYLSRSGKKLKFTKLILLSFFKIINELKITNNNLQAIIQDWRSIHILLKVSSQVSGNLNKGSLLKNLYVNSHTSVKHADISKLNEYTIDNILKQNFKKFNFLFSFYIYKVDKQIYKNSRGRSGKYTFVWKYVAPYKRHFLIMHWLMKEVRISSGKTLEERVYNVLRNFIINTQLTWIWKIKKFSLNYVYFNLRKTLGETYKTSMR